MRLPRSGRMPPSDAYGHWRFPVAEKVMVRGGTRDELILRIHEYRMRHNIPMGNADRDIDRWYCDQWPGFCHPEPSDSDPTAYDPPNEPMLNRVSRWASTLIHQMPKGGYVLVAKSDAVARGAICAACPKQDPTWRGGCGGCSSTTLQILQQIKALKTTPHDGALSACSILGFQTGAAVWLPVEVLTVTPEQNSALPAACWRKQTP